jgi:hypothetical protein
LAGVMLRMDGMATKDDVEQASQEVIQTVTDAFSSVPNRIEFVGLERRVRLIEDKVK